MLKNFLVLRYVSLTAVVFSFLGSVLMFFIGSTRTIDAFETFFFPQEAVAENPHLSKSDRATIELVESVDAFLFALILLIFSYGIFRIFISKEEDTAGFRWLQIDNVGQLKVILVEVIVVILCVFFLKLTLIHLEQSSWEMMILPCSILLLSISLFLLRKGHE